jgi:hypothetical protein
MMTVRFPSGFSVRYNDAGFLRYMDRGWELYTANPDKGGKWVASIALNSGAIVEVKEPCRTYNAMRDPSGTIEAALAIIRRREVASWSDLRNVAALKLALNRFNARSRCWK